MTHVTVLLDWSNYVFAKMEPVIEAFLASDIAEQARGLLAELHEQQHDLDTVRKFQNKLRYMLRAHAKEYRKRISEDIEHPERLLQDYRPASDGHTLQQQQHTSIHLIVVAEQGKKGRWKSPQLVLEKAKQLAEHHGVDVSEFEGLGTAAQPETADTHIPQPAPDARWHEQQLARELEYRIRGALIFIARNEVENALKLGTARKQFQIPGTTADEAIAAIAHANAGLHDPITLCIVSDDTDFWQLKSYDISQVGIKYELQLKAADMPQHYLKKEALLGKGRDDLNSFGTVFGPVPHGIECIDAAGTAVVGDHRPKDAVYAQQFAAFDGAVKQQEPWQLGVPDVLDWLQQFQHQVPSIRARFLIKMVHHNIDPYSDWSAMPLDIQQHCTEAANTALKAAAAAAAAAAAEARPPSLAAVQPADWEEWLPRGPLGSSSGNSCKKGGVGSSGSSSSKPKKKGQTKGRR